jgi:hypothetical protein
VLADAGGFGGAGLFGPRHGEGSRLSVVGSRCGAGERLVERTRFALSREDVVERTRFQAWRMREKEAS